MKRRNFLGLLRLAPLAVLPPAVALPVGAAVLAPKSPLSRISLNKEGDLVLTGRVNIAGATPSEPGHLCIRGAEDNIRSRTGLLGVAL